MSFSRTLGIISAGVCLGSIPNISHASSAIITQTADRSMTVIFAGRLDKMEGVTCKIIKQDDGSYTTIHIVETEAARLAVQEIMSKNLSGNDNAWPVDDTLMKQVQQGKPCIPTPGKGKEEALIG